MIDQICSQPPDVVENKIRDLRMLLYTVCDDRQPEREEFQLANVNLCPLAECR